MAPCIEDSRISLHSLLGIDLSRDCTVSLVGAGGKTTILYYLAHELAALGKQIAITTTTHISHPQKQECESVVTDENRDAIYTALHKKRLVVVGTPAKEGKLSSPSPSILKYLHDEADYLLIEADGSHRLPVKLPNETEPVIYPETDKIIAVAGLSALGKPLGQVCHRLSLAKELLGVEDDFPLTEQSLVKMLLHGYGGCDIMVLNQADTAALQEQGARIAAPLLKAGIPCAVVTSFSGGEFHWYSVHKRASKSNIISEV